MKWVGPVKAQRGRAVPSVAEADRVVEMRHYNMLYTVEINILVTLTSGILYIKLLLNQTVTVALPYWSLLQ